MSACKVKINGRQESVAERTTIAELLQAQGLRSEWVVVEHNGNALIRARFPEIELEEGDRLEIVRAVAGGS